MVVCQVCCIVKIIARDRTNRDIIHAFRWRTNICGLAIIIIPFVVIVIRVVNQMCVWAKFTFHEINITII